jgi:transposase
MSNFVKISVVCCGMLWYNGYMKIYYDKRAKDPIYYIQHGFRNGKKSTTRNVGRIGKHSELLKITDDPLAYAKEQVKLLNDGLDNKKVTMDMTIDFSERIKSSEEIVSSSNQVNIGYFILQKIYQDLRISDFFKGVTADSKITFDPNQINRFLTYARILEPDSKLGTYDHLCNYFEKPEFKYVHILRTMDILEENYDEYITYLFKYSNNIITRDTSVCYFDCTNYYFEIECEDDNYVDEVTGEFIKGFRKYGYSKQHKPNPLVEMGLFMDSRGIPLTMCINSGSDNEQTCAIPLEKKLTRMLEGKKFIYCADAGLGSLNIRKFNSMGGRSFIVTQSIKKLSDPLKKAVFNDYDYRLLSNNRPFSVKAMKEFDKKDTKYLELYNDSVYKVINADKPIDLGLYEEKVLKNGKIKKVKSKAVVKQKIIITFSRKLMEYQRYIRNNQIERAKNILATRDPETIKKGPSDSRRFIKRRTVSKSGEPVMHDYYIDQILIDEEERYDGYYALATNLDDDAKSIIEVNSKRHRIEDCFRVMKTNFSARPINHRNRERIVAHFMICYTALLVYRLLEAKLDDNGTHFSIENIIETLKNMGVLNSSDMYYQSTYNGSQVCTALNTIFGLELDKKYYLPKTLNKKIKDLLK